MSKMSKTFWASMIMILLVLMPACRTTKKNVKTDTQPPVMDTTPTVPPPPPPVETPVEQKDFVQENNPQPEVVPTDETELNNWARGKGYIRDAFYNYDEATLDDAAQAALTASATWLRSDQGSGYKLLIEGHCDERGTEQYNLALGDRRANSAKDYLVTLGVDAGRIRTVSYGEERPFEDGHDDASWSQNRRAHLVLVR
ncbi:MAG TPA: OmpA family protein [Thermoanaerobaculia bacterium]|nr:OmpA family protein [Thermoanaerobaculia bacterium]